MTTQPPFPFRPRQRKFVVVDNMDFIERVMRLWDVGCDTYQIAESMFEPEHLIAKALHRGRERRRNAHEAT